GSISALPSLDLLLNHIPGSVPALSSLVLLLNHIPGSVPALSSLDLLLNHIPVVYLYIPKESTGDYAITLKHFFSGLDRARGDRPNDDSCRPGEKPNIILANF